MLDAILFEKRGIPAAAVLTEPFIPTAHALAEIQQMPNYPFVVLPHPVTSLTEEQVRERADWATDWVETLLLRSGAQPEWSGSVDSEATSSWTEEERVERFVEELGRPLRADGAALVGGASSNRQLDLRLEISDSACAECIMPGRYLEQLFNRRAAAALGEDWRVSLEDPREAAVASRASNG